MAPPSIPIVNEKDLNDRVEELKKQIADCDELLATDPTQYTKFEVLRAYNRLTNVLRPLERATPTASAAEVLDHWANNVAPVLRTASLTECDLKTILDMAKDFEQRKQNTATEEDLEQEHDDTVSDITSKIGNVNIGSTPRIPRANLRSHAFTPKHFEVKLPQFAGNCADYPGFIAAFQAYTNTPNTDGSLKFLVLSNHLTGPAKKFVRGLHPSSESLAEALAAMDLVYGKKSRIVEELKKELRDLPDADDTADSLRNTYLDLESIFRALSQNGVDVNNDDQYRQLAMSKYPDRIQIGIAPDGVVTMQHLRVKMLNIIDQRMDTEAVKALKKSTPATENSKDVLAYPAIDNKSKKRDNRDRRDKKDTTDTTKKDSPPSSRTCVFCNGSHYSTECSKFPFADQRQANIPRDRCFKCLGVGHSAKNCNTRYSCYYCRKKGHHSSLCYEKFGKAENKDNTQVKTEQPKKEEPTKAPQVNFCERERRVFAAMNERGMLLSAMGWIRNPATKAKMRIRIFFDPGAESSFVATRAAQLLRLQRNGNRDLRFRVFLDDAGKNVNSDNVYLQVLSDRSPELAIEVNADVVDQLPTIQTANLTTFRQRFPLHDDLQFAEPGEGVEVMLMIGVDYAWHFLKGEPSIQVEPGLWLVDTVFGWVVSGRTVDHSPLRAVHSIQTTVADMWALESIGIKEPDLKADEEEQIALDLFQRDITYLKDEKRYQVGWPWRQNPPPIPTNFGLAAGIARSLFTRTKAEYLQIIAETLKQQEKSGIIERVENAVPIVGATNYLPYHLVVRTDKATTPVRMVFNGSAKASKSATSLNESIYKGVNLLPSLVDILLRFRFGAHVATADIEKAFHQLVINPADRDFLRFLVIEKTEKGEDLVTYRFRRVPFGIIASPFMLAGAIDHLLSTSGSDFARTVKENLYVDNLILTFDNEEEIKRLQRDMIDIFATVSMNLRQWNSDVEEVRNAVPPEKRDEEIELSILGVKWSRESDLLHFTGPTAATANLKQTMRTVLKIAAQVFDPLGYLSPTTIRAKHLLQRCHQRKANWDDLLTTDELAQWKLLVEDLLRLSTIEIPRKIADKNFAGKRIQFHLFSDASQNVYAATVYIRISPETSQKVNTSLILAKARVAPLKKQKLTIPRLELMAALIASRLIATVRNALKFHEDAPAILWVDSRCVLAWLHPSAILTTFVRKRVEEIILTPNLQFRYVPTAENIADFPTRFATTEEMSTKLAWWNGPEWLSLPESCWPPQKNSAQSSESYVDQSPPEKETVASVKKIEPWYPLSIDASKFTSFKRLIRVTMYSLRFLRNLAPSRIGPLIESNAYDVALHLWITAEQQNYYTETIDAVKKGTRLTDLAKRIRPKLDQRGLLRFGGRFHEAPDQFLARHHPIILPKPSVSGFTRLLVLHLHTSIQHAGTTSTLNTVQKNYWFPQARREIYGVILRCPQCIREAARPYTQPTQSHLPPFRLEAGATPFQNSGIDIFGPIEIQKTKKWVVLMTCLVMRGVALEVIDSLHTYEIYDAVRRIAARRTMPSFFLSDNAAQFKLLQQHIEANSLTRVEWKFTPAYAPWNGGAYERLVGVTKSSLHRCLQTATKIGPTQFRTLIAEIENAVNSRPLTPISADPSCAAITPNDILRVQITSGQIENAIPASNTAAAKLLAQLSRHNNEVFSQFWSNWKSSYLASLRDRPQTQQFQRNPSARNPALGDVVIIRDDLRERGKWKLGRVLELVPGADHVIRAAKLRLGTGHTVVHPLKDLYPLELDAPPVQPDDNDEDVVTLGPDDLSQSTPQHAVNT